MMPVEVAPITEILAEIKQGRMVVLVDEEDRENEGDLVMAAEYVTPEAINFMARWGRGLICLTLLQARCQQLNLPLMVQENKAQHGTAFTVSIEAATGVTTGISAADRARTVQAAVAKDASPADLVQPGHVFPLMAQNGGVLVRAGHTEAGCDLAALAGCEPAAVICEIMNEDGSMARLPELGLFARQHGLKIGTIADLIHYRAASEKLVQRLFSKPVSTVHGAFTLHVYEDRASGATHLALSRGEIRPEEETLVRVHEPLSVLDFLDPGGRRAAFTLDEAQAALVKHGHGVIVLMYHPERGEDLRARLQVDPLQERAPLKWDPRIYGIGAQILRDLGVGRMRLLASPRKIPSMVGFGLEVTACIASPAELG